MSEQKRPPRGIMPYDLWLECRATELGAAIHRTTKFGCYMNVYNWILELTHIMELRFPYLKNERTRNKFPL